MIRIEGHPAEPVPDASIVECEPGVYSILQNGASFEVRVAPDRVEINGHTLRYERDDPRQWKRSTASAASANRAAIVAPMPGKVVRILVTVGDIVTAGQGILVVEAMKMQNELKSPIDGVVAKLSAAENDSTTAGAILAVIEVAG